MRLSYEDSWEDRLLHLQKLRALQDELQGFKRFNLVIRSAQIDRDTELKEKAVLVADAFLNDIPVVRPTRNLISDTNLLS